MCSQALRDGGIVRLNRSCRRLVRCQVAKAGAIGGHGVVVPQDGGGYLLELKYVKRDEGEAELDAALVERYLADERLVRQRPEVVYRLGGGLPRLGVGPLRCRRVRA